MMKPLGNTLRGFGFFIKRMYYRDRNITKMGGLKKKCNNPLSVFESRGKGGNITVIRHRTSGFRTLTISGKCKTPKGLSDSSLLNYSISAIGYELQHQFPDFFKQNRASAILTYSLPATSEKRDSSSGFHYDFQYTMNDGPDNETVISQLLPLIPSINEKITSCMLLVHQQVCDP